MDNIKDLSILCMTKGEPYALPFLESMRELAGRTGAALVVGLDDTCKDIKTVERLYHASDLYVVKSLGYIESVLDHLVEQCPEGYILRLDDDERCSPVMESWILRREYRVADHWKFPRVHLWPDTRSMLNTPHLWPDWQTRLSVKAKSGGRTTVHAGSPFGGGKEAFVVIEHHKFLVKSYEERLRIAKTYDAFSEGYGTGGMLPFSLPEDAYQQVEILSYDLGQFEWCPAWRRTVPMEIASCI